MNRALLSFLFALIAVPFAQADVLMDRPVVHTATNPVTLVRTSATPADVTVTMPIEFQKTQCVETATRMEYGRNPVCGYETVLQRRCTMRQVCREVCRIVNGRRICRQECHPEQVCTVVPVQVMRACYYPVTYCARYGLVPYMESRQVQFRFRDVVDLAPGQMERYELSGHQDRPDGTNDLFLLNVLESAAPYKVIYRDGADRFTISR